MTQPLLFWASSPSCSPFWALPLCRPPSSSSTSLTSERHAKVSTLISSLSPPPPQVLYPPSLSLCHSLSLVNEESMIENGTLQPRYKTLQHFLFIVLPYFHQYLCVCTHSIQTPTLNGLIHKLFANNDAKRVIHMCGIELLADCGDEYVHLYAVQQPVLVLIRGDYITQRPSDADNKRSPFSTSAASHTIIWPPKVDYWSSFKPWLLPHRAAPGLNG